MKDVNIHPCLTVEKKKKEQREAFQSRYEYKKAESQLFLVIFMAGFIACGLIAMAISTIGGLISG